MRRDSEESLVCLSESSRPRVPLCVRAFRLDEWRRHLGGWMTMPAVPDGVVEGLVRRCEVGMSCLELQP